MIEAAAGRLAKHIKSVVPDHPTPEEDLNHSLIIIINFFTVVGLAMIGAIFTGQFKETLLLLQCFAILRQLTGGLHLESSTWCAVATAGAATALSLVTLNDSWVITLTAGAAVLVALYAPSGIERQTIIPPRFFPILRVVGTLVVASNFWFNSSVAAIAFFVQALTLVANEHFTKGGETT